MSENKKFDCIMLNADISKEDWKKYLDIIKEDDIFDDENNEYRLCNKPHITLLFGIHSDEVDRDVAEAMLKSVRNIELEIEGISIFENEEYDVVKLDVTPSDVLLQLRALFIDTLPNTQTFDGYHPHVTISYVKKGKGKDYVKKYKKPKTMCFNEGVYSDYEYKKKTFKFKPLNESMAGMWDDINTAMRLNDEGVKKSEKESDDLRSYVNKGFKHMKKYKQFVNESYNRMFECPNCQSCFTEDVWKENSKECILFGMKPEDFEFEDGEYDCPDCGDVCVGADCCEV